MYFILEIKPQFEKIDEEIININIHTSLGMAFATNQLENCAKEYIKEEFGNSALNGLEMKNYETIIDHEQLKIGVYLYKGSNAIYVYHKYEKLTPGLIWGKSSIPVFECIRIFILKQYDGLKNERKQDEVEFVKVNRVNMPRPMTISPFADVINSLKKSEKFLKRQNSDEIKPEVSDSQSVN